MTVDFLIALDQDFGFPSGEAMALALYRDTRRKLAISVLLAIEADLVLISRIYVRGHYPIDVVGGILLGVGLPFIFVGVQKHVESILIQIHNILQNVDAYYQ